jgi:hypothetical protein
MSINRDDPPRPAVDGPPAWVNWRAAEAGAPSTGAVEIPLYSDARFTGEVSSGLGPYQYFNAVSHLHGHGLVRPAVVLRIGLHAEFETQIADKTDAQFYYGGWLSDELAALASLLVGARFKAGGETRHFTPGGDSRGRPFDRALQPEPTLTTLPHAVILPAHGADRSLMPLEKLARYPNISPNDAVALVRAARLYQDAVWISESEPNLAWIMLVSAVESAASRWRTSSAEATSLFTAAHPELSAYLESIAADLLERIASEFSHTLRVTAKFVEFLVAHLPPAPTVRPEEWRQVVWNEPELTQAFRIIYRYRSRALHDGIPFPSPMCDIAQYVGRSDIPGEKPYFISSSHQGATWFAKDVPMRLHIFEYIARHALIQWFDDLATT